MLATAACVRFKRAFRGLFSIRFFSCTPVAKDGRNPFAQGAVRGFVLFGIPFRGTLLNSDLVRSLVICWPNAARGQTSASPVGLAAIANSWVGVGL